LTVLLHVELTLCIMFVHSADVWKEGGRGPWCSLTGFTRLQLAVIGVLIRLSRATRSIGHGAYTKTEWVYPIVDER